MNRIFITALVSLLALPSISQTYPGASWETAENPHEQGINQDQSRQLFRYIRDSSVVTGMVIVHKGKIVFEYGDVTQTGYIASCRKSILSILYGQYVEDGTIDLDITIGELGMDDIEGLMDIEKTATIRHLIEARSGIYHPEGYSGGWQQWAPERGSVEPGSYWLYNNWDFNAAGFVFEKLTGKNIYDEVERQLAIPLGFEDWDRSKQRKQGDTTRSEYLAYPMWISSRDLARVGLLMLNKGKWEGEQLISESWVNEMLKQRTTSEEMHKNMDWGIEKAGGRNNFKANNFNFGYGYMWWLWEKEEDPRFMGAYSALGAMGQTITVYPAMDVVMTYKTRDLYRRSNSMDVRLALLRKTGELFSGFGKEIRDTGN